MPFPGRGPPPPPAELLSAGGAGSFGVPATRTGDKSELLDAGEALPRGEAVPSRARLFIEDAAEAASTIAAAAVAEAWAGGKEEVERDDGVEWWCRSLIFSRRSAASGERGWSSNAALAFLVHFVNLVLVC